MDYFINIYSNQFYKPVRKYLMVYFNDVFIVFDCMLIQIIQNSLCSSSSVVYHYSRIRLLNLIIDQAQKQS
jgi:hypothetical protein